MRLTATVILLAGAVACGSDAPAANPAGPGPDLVEGIDFSQAGYTFFGRPTVVHGDSLFVLMSWPDSARVFRISLATFPDEVRERAGRSTVSGAVELTR